MRSGNRARQVTTRITAFLAVCALPVHVASQSDFEIAVRDAPEEAIHAIQEIERAAGANSADLIEPLTTLGMRSEVEGDLSLAAAAFARAREIVRINLGFDSMEEAFVLRALVRTEYARSNFGVAWDLEQELLDLVWPSHDIRGSEEYPTDLRAVPILNEIADRRMAVLDEYRGGEFPPQIVLGCYYDRERGEDCNSGNRIRMMSAIASEANWYRAAAIRAMVANEEYASRELRELEAPLLGSGRKWSDCPEMTVQELLATEILGSCLDPIIRQRRLSAANTSTYATIANVGGEATLMRFLIYEVRSGAPTLNQVSALVRLADWQIRHPFSRRSGSREYGNSALEIYEYAYDRVGDIANSQEIANQFFSPEIPVVLETFLPEQLRFEEVTVSTGYIDVAFDITKFGNAVDIAILDTTENVSRRHERDLIRLIEHSAFRPRLTEGQFAESSHVETRYFLHE